MSIMSRERKFSLPCNKSCGFQTFSLTSTFFHPTSWQPFLSKRLIHFSTLLKVHRIPPTTLLLYFLFFFLVFFPFKFIPLPFLITHYHVFFIISTFLRKSIISSTLFGLYEFLVHKYPPIQSFSKPNPLSLSRTIINLPLCHQPKAKGNNIPYFFKKINCMYSFLFQIV